MAFAILLIGFLVGLYQAALRGGDLQALAVTAIKYLVVAMILSNWTTVFRDVNGSFTAVADFVSNSSGAGDMFMNWMTQLQQQATTNPNLTFWDMITGDISGTITVGLLLIAYIVYALAIIIFCFFYTLYGTVLYVIGPLVLALIPVSGIGQLGKTYAINLMIWNAWGILYSVFGALITAIHFNQVNNVLGNGFLGFLQGVPDSTMLGLVSIFYALAIAMVPFIAKGIISGDVGSTGIALVRAAATAAGAALAAVERICRRCRRWRSRNSRRGGSRCGRRLLLHGDKFIHASSNSGDINGGIPAIGRGERDEQQQQSGCAGGKWRHEREFRK